MKEEDPSKVQEGENHAELVLKVLLVGAPKSVGDFLQRRDQHLDVTFFWVTRNI